jgi:hypothetical protein
LKTLEHRDNIGRRDDGAAVRHMQPGGAALLAAADPNPATGHVVPNRILEQVADQTVEQARVANGAGRRNLLLDRDVALRRFPLHSLER